jgi:hypothetical protein
VDGFFAAGNVVHPAETADVAALRARTVGHTAARWLRGAGGASDRGKTRLRVDDPLLWVVPNLTGANPPKGDAMLIRSRTFLDHPRLELRQAGRSVASYRLRRMIPNRSQAIPADWQGQLQSDGEVSISVAPPGSDGA